VIFFHFKFFLANLRVERAALSVATRHCCSVQKFVKDRVQREIKMVPQIY